MTMGLGFIFGDGAYLAADKRTTKLNTDGSNRSYSDGSCKIFMLSESVYAFCGGVVQATQPLIVKIIEELSGKDLNESHISRISQLCREQYKAFIDSIDEGLKTSTWVKDFVLSVIIAQNIEGNPRLIRYDIEDNFEPVIQSDNGAICIKSAIAPEVLWPEIQKILNILNQKGFSPLQFIANILLRASELDMSISPTYDLFTVSPIMKKGSYSFQKISAGTITATISITSPNINGGVITGSELNGGIINGGVITGATFNNGNGTFRVTSEGVLYATSANISGRITGSEIIGSTITSNSTINVSTDVRIGSKLYIGPGGSISGGIYFNTGDGDNLTADPGGALTYTSWFKAYGLNAEIINGDRIYAGNGDTGSFKTVDGKTVTVTKGIITSIV